MMNMEVRLHARERGVSLWMLAEAMGVSEPTLYRKLRRELPQTEKERMLAAVTKLCKQGVDKKLKLKENKNVENVNAQ